VSRERQTNHESPPARNPERDEGMASQTPLVSRPFSCFRDPNISCFLAADESQCFDLLAASYSTFDLVEKECHPTFGYYLDSQSVFY
jgi:hypothetical protein